jgi:hypothetical protein
LKLVCSIHSVALLNITLFKSKKIRCALFVLQKECRKVWGARYTLGARYRSENTVFAKIIISSSSSSINSRSIVVVVVVEVVVEVAAVVVVVAFLLFGF